MLHVKYYGSGAYITGIYCNLFKEMGYVEKEIDAKIEKGFQETFSWRQRSGDTNEPAALQRQIQNLETGIDAEKTKDKNQKTNGKKSLISNR